MNNQVRKRIAETMKIEAAQIMDYRRQEDGTYTVILFNFRKYRGIVAADAPARGKSGSAKK